MFYLAKNGRHIHHGSVLSEGSRLAAVVAEIPRSAADVLRRLSAEALLFCRAHSSGSRCVRDAGTAAPPSRAAMVGPWARFMSTAVPVVSPEAVVMERRQQQLFVDPARAYGYFADIWPRATELLVSPLEGLNGKLGAAWVVLHDDSRRFDGEDQRRLSVITQCASAAYRVACSYHRDSAAAPRPSMPTMPTSLPRVLRPLSKREREVCHRWRMATPTRPLPRAWA